MNPFPLKRQLTGRRMYRHFRLFMKALFDQELTYHAASLSFYTIFSVIPIFLIVLTMITNLPSFEEHYLHMKTFLIENLMPVHSETITQYIDSFLANSIKLSLIGFIMMIVASLLFFQNFEHIVNKIFHTKSRTFWQSVTTYWTMLTLTPLALLLSFYISAQIAVVLQDYTISKWVNIMVIFPYMIIWALFFFIYKISANTYVRTKAALISSFVIAIVWSVAKNTFVYYVFYNKSYTTIYGSFSILLFFFLWIYLSWIIFTYGLKLCYLINRAYQHSDRRAKKYSKHSRITHGQNGE
jgi:membrane protein